MGSRKSRAVDLALILGVGTAAVLLIEPQFHQVIATQISAQAVPNDAYFLGLASQLYYTAGFLMVALAAVLYLFFSANRKERQRDELEQAKKEARQAGQVKTEFIARMSHEIRTPLTELLGMNDLTLRESRDPADRERAQRIKEAGEELLATVNSIMDLGKIESGSIELHESDYSLREMVGETASPWNAQAKKRGLVFVTEIEDSVPDALTGDVGKIRRILGILVGGAIRRGRAGRITLSVHAEAGHSVLETRLLFCVSGTDMNLSVEEMEKIRALFGRRQNDPSGSGEEDLELLLADSYARMLGGGLRVSAGGGRDAAITLEVSQRTRTERTHLRFEAPGAKVLLVDDNEMNLRVLEEMLRPEKVQIEKCRSGKEALQRMCREQYDLIFLDDLMPGMTGVETLRIAGAMEGNRNWTTPVVAATGTVLSGSREKYLAAGFADYLPKPVRMSQLERMLARFLPPEKVNLIQEEAEKKEEQVKQEETPASAGGEALVDVGAGIALCDGEEDLYYVIASMFAGEYREKREQIEKYYEAGDWNNYLVFVHALGSTSLQAGCTVLSGRARAQEAMVQRIVKNPALAETVIPRIRAEHEPLMELYERSAQAAGAVSGKGAPE
ncbi:MAG: response regulator [Lachnospiraceae bacterium]